jgi:hypothetical protein
MLGDLTRELLWTRTLRTPALALRPSRILLGMAGALIATVIGSIPIGTAEQPTFAQSVSDRIALFFSNAAADATRLDARGMFFEAAELARFPGTLIQDRPWATVLLAIPMIVALALFGGAIARAAAIEFTSARYSDWPADLRVSLRSLGSSAGALIAPLALVGVIVLLTAVGGAMLGVPVLDLIGAILYALAMLFALLAVLILMLHVLALPMLVPALMIEGTDAFDAVQRCYAYILARPLHLLLHASLLLVLGAISVGLCATIASATDQLVQWSASRFAADAGLEVLTGNGELSATQPAAHSIIEFYRSLTDLVVSGFAISYYFCAGTVLYLVARRICDGQDVNDLWNPNNARN